MKKLTSLFVLCLLYAGTVAAQIPDTPAGRQFLAWQKAQDSGDQATIQEFLNKNMPWGTVEQELSFHHQSGGYEIRGIIESSETRLAVLAKEQRGLFQQTVKITINVESSPPNRITGIMIRPVETPPDNPGRLGQIQDTPAGRQLLAWQRAQDSGDRATIQDFINKEMPWGNVEQELAQHNQSGGFDVKKMESSSGTQIVVLAQERGPLNQYFRITINVDSAEPHHMAGIMVQPVQPPSEVKQPNMTKAEVAVARTASPFRQFSAWLEAFNTGDRTTIDQFLRANFPSASLDEQLSFRQRTGGFELRKLERATPTTLAGLVQERDSDQFARFGIAVEPSEPNRILELPINAVQRPVEFPVAPMSDAEIVTALRARIEKETVAGRFAGTAILAKNGKVLFSGAYGLADRQKGRLNDLDTRFRIGSMNKMFTAVSILQLVQLGKIKLADPLGKYVADYPSRDVASKVTIHHLLTHTGGTGDIFGPEFDAHRSELRTLNDYLALFGKRGLSFEPGSDWEYSNYGMLLLGVVIERVSGQNYYDFVVDHIYKPTGMTHSGSEPEDEAISGLSIGYMHDQHGAWVPNTVTLPYRGTSAGGGYSTVSDLLKFADALLDHRLLSTEYTDLLLAGKAGPGGSRIYAYGFEDERIGGIGAVGHAGGAPGMNGDLKIYPISGHVVAVLSNLDPPAAQKISEFVDLRIIAQAHSLM